MLRVTIFLTVILTAFWSCKTSKSTTDSLSIASNSPATYKGRSLIFGNGGGFAGTVTSYTLRDNGGLFRGVATGPDEVPVTSLDERLTEQMFRNYDQQKFGEMDLNEPSNLYFFVKMKEKDGSMHNITWSDRMGPTNLKIFYKTLIDLAATKTVIKKSNRPSAVQ